MVESVVFNFHHDLKNGEAHYRCSYYSSNRCPVSVNTEGEFAIYLNDDDHNHDTMPQVVIACKNAEETMSFENF